jgi:hypothetical protein
VVKKDDVLFHQKSFRSEPRVPPGMKPGGTHSLRAKSFLRRTRRRKKRIEFDSRPAGRELCEAFDTMICRPRAAYFLSGAGGKILLNHSAFLH